jgi:hypothetical protein
MTQRVALRKPHGIVIGAIALGLWLVPASVPASAAPTVARLDAFATPEVTPARIYRRGRTPIYPYYYNPGRPGGYSFYFGFVPYAPGNVENQAIQRNQYPQNTEWPPGLYGGPRPGWEPKAAD